MARLGLGKQPPPSSLASPCSVDIFDRILEMNDGRILAERAAGSLFTETIFPQQEIIIVRALTIVLALCLVGSIACAESSPEEKSACEADYKKYCSIVPSDDENITLIIACLKQNTDKLSEQCRKIVEKK
jgi:hypothetical protein